MTFEEFELKFAELVAKYGFERQFSCDYLS